jgi:hypothetical protein
MEPIFIAVLFGGVGGGVGGYLLASHIHSVANTATSNTVISGAASAVTGAISAVHNDVKALAAKVDSIAAPAVVAPKVIIPAAPAATPIKTS